MKKTNKIYVFFDLDRTLLAYDSMLLFCNYILKRERIRTLFLLLFIPALLLRLFRIINNLELKRIFFSFLFLIRPPVLKYYCKDFVKQSLIPLFFEELLYIIDKHRKAGHFTVLNTASIDLYAKHIARELKFDAYYATKMNLEDPMPLIPKIHKNNFGAQKIIAMEDILPNKIVTQCQKTGNYFRPPSIKSAFTYTDSIADLPLIYLANNITIVQPSQKKMKDFINKNNIDVIYPKNRIGARPFAKIFYLLYFLRNIIGL